MTPQPKARKARAKAKAGVASRPPPLAAPEERNEALGRPLWQLVPLSPKKLEDNYEISDKEETDDEAEERPEPDRSKKHKPAWCAEKSVEELCAAQGACDPDSIFGFRVPKCDLEEIFPDVVYKKQKKLQPRRRRGSSALWYRDRLSRSEIINYRDKMGQVRRWSLLPLGAEMKKNGVKYESSASSV